MKLRILGCHGGETPTMKAASFLVDGQFLLDTGSLTRALSIEEQRGLEHIFISHTHLDHVRDIGLLIDNTFAARNRPFQIYCTPTTAKGLRENYFNNVIWPDFLQIPNPVDPENRPMLVINEIEPGDSFRAGDYDVQTVLVDHQVETVAAIVRAPNGSSFAYCCDTGPTQNLWEVLNKEEGLKAIIAEISFTDDMQELAKVSGHLTPVMLQAELENFKPVDPECQVLIFGLKPAFYDRLIEDIPKLDLKNATILHPGTSFDF